MAQYNYCTLYGIMYIVHRRLLCVKFTVSVEISKKN